MIISSYVLSTFIDIGQFSQEEISLSLNDIGIEVERCFMLEIPHGVIVGKVLEVSPHMNASKLSICRVDIGDRVLQIVCGASNVASNQYVALATIGTRITTKNTSTTIALSMIRGVESDGMICSARELGLCEVGDGIMVLDDSIGTLELGKALYDYPFFKQYFLEVSPTPNRGDCLYVLGIARELAAKHNLALHLPHDNDYGIALGIGRAMTLIAERHITSCLMYKVANISQMRHVLAWRIILAYNGLDSNNPLENALRFVMYMSGVIFTMYPLQALVRDEGDYALLQDAGPTQALYINSPISLRVMIKEGMECVCDDRGEVLCIIGVKNLMPDTSSALVIIQASFSPPDILAKALFHTQQKADTPTAYRSVRGSNPDLSLGMNMLCNVLMKHAQCLFYQGAEVLDRLRSREQERITLDLRTIPQALGIHVEKEEIARILKQLHFSIEASGEGRVFHIAPPIYRHDITSEQDVIEEFLRMYGISNIPALPYHSAQHNAITPTLLRYKHMRHIAGRALTLGFYESIHYVFCARETLLQWGYGVLDARLDVANPITSDLNTLRTSLIPGLFHAARHNHNLGYKQIKMFEIGSIYDASRTEHKGLGIIACGLKDEEGFPYPKGQKWDFFSMASEVSAIIGGGRFMACENPPRHAHPHICASIIYEDKPIGILARVHPRLERELQLSDAFYAEIFSIPSYSVPSRLRAISKFHPSMRDITIIIDKSISFHRIYQAIFALKDTDITELYACYPLDVYEDEAFALTIRLVFRSFTQSLTEEKLAHYVKLILTCLEQSFHAQLKL